MVMVSDTRSSYEGGLGCEEVSDTSWEVRYALAIEGGEVSDTSLEIALRRRGKILSRR